MIANIRNIENRIISVPARFKIINLKNLSIHIHTNNIQSVVDFPAANGQAAAIG